MDLYSKVFMFLYRVNFPFTFGICACLYILNYAYFPNFLVSWILLAPLLILIPIDTNLIFIKDYKQLPFRYHLNRFKKRFKL